jgi:hypothetical protein
VGSVGVSMGCDTFLIFESVASNGKIHFNSSIFSFSNDIDYKVISICFTDRVAYKFHPLVLLRT